MSTTSLSPGALLPLPEPPPPFFQDGANDLDSRESEESGHTTRVIVIDDESRISSTLVEILKGEGFEARAASTGEEALALAREFRPDVVLSDVIIPGLNGIEVGIQLRELLPKCRVILFSGQAATLDLLKSARARGHEFEILAKPIKPAALLSIIRR
jgi:CheY-like chemotaxis protein